MPRHLLVLALVALVPGGCAKRVPPGAIPPTAPVELTEPDVDEDGIDDDVEPIEGEGAAPAASDDDGFGAPADAKSGGGAPAKPAAPAAGGPTPKWAQAAATKIAGHAKGKRSAWDRLATMVDRFGARPSGSRSLEQAIDWAVETMRSDGLANARREPVMVPHWQRGKESLVALTPTPRTLRLLGLGGTVGTKGTLRAPLMVVGDLDELDRRATEAKGKIVLVNQKMPPYDHERDESGYGTAVRPRSEGASRAAKHGAVALLIRSVTAVSLDNPHTGAMRYDDAVPKIPAAAVTIEGAEFLARTAARGPVTMQLSMGAKRLPDARSGNAIAELVGREKPDEVVVIGGHIDSWDVGDGASDDGAGCVMAMEAARILKELELTPRRTIRVVLFTNEEFGLRGGKAYFEAHGKEPHVAAIESDSGAGAPQGFGVAGKDQAPRHRAATLRAALRVAGCVGHRSRLGRRRHLATDRGRRAEPVTATRRQPLLRRPSQPRRHHRQDRSRSHPAQRGRDGLDGLHPRRARVAGAGHCAAAICTTRSSSWHHAVRRPPYTQPESSPITRGVR
ncbi:MAG: M20/M25/M40 family metallo-hydrolase [Deltaproteobacteria bacterium]|nr:M20/M25/M40 family metallo-hydrolase [Deltaproteobacteria bacterium]